MQLTQIAVISKQTSPQITAVIEKITNFLQQLKITVCVEYDQNEYLKTKCNVTLKPLASDLKQIDLVIVIGGDGTLLSVARRVVDYKIPIIGINQGKLGFMTDVVVEDMLDVLHKIIIQKEYFIEERSLLFAEIIREKNKIYSAIALNDVVISRGAIGNMIEFDISIDNQFVLSQKSDGIIFATPTGSTAYSLAAGGPILHPHAPVFSIIPICPQALTNRPIVISDKANIEFVLARENATQIHFDGQECFDLQLNDIVKLTKYQQVLKLIHSSEYNYFKTLRSKLDWSKRVS